MAHPAPSLPAAEPSGDQPLIRGTLTYTRRSLAILLFWLLWGDFCYVLMEAVVPSIMPLKLKALGASNLDIGFILGSIPGTIIAFLNPVISFRSDRHRGPWGRRIPFLLGSLPFIVLLLVLIAYGETIAGLLHQHVLPEVTEQRLGLWTYAVLLIAFTFFNAFVQAVFWYLFNDVVPEHLLARFMSWFRVIGMSASAAYNLFVFGHAEHHATTIFLGAAFLYGITFSLMALFVREGSYPPPPPLIDGKTGPLAALKTYAVECHGHGHYWYLWTATCIGSIGAGIGMFTLFFNQHIGLNLAQIGTISGTVSIVVGVLVLGSGWLADRYHPIRIAMLGSGLGLLVGIPANMLWIFWHPQDPALVYAIAFAIAVGIGAPISALNCVMDPPLLMRLFPRSHYGQFCSANNLWRTMGTVIGGSAAGLFIDAMVALVGEEQGYRMIPVWQFCFAVPSFVLLVLLYRSWQRHGGDAGYVPPLRAASPAP